MKQQIQQLINRTALSLNGYDFATNETVDHAANAKAYLLTLASAQTNLMPTEGDSAEVKTAKAKALQTVRDALAGDREAIRSLNALRLETVDNFVKAGSNWMRFFDVISLRNDEEPGIKNTTMNEIRVGYVAQHGAPRMIKVPPHDAHTRIPLRDVSTEKVGYFTRDIYRGDIAALAQATFDLGFDLQFKLDRLAFDLYTAPLGSGGAFGAFVTTGARVSRDYNAHSGIITSHLPTTNDITVYTDAIGPTGIYNDPASAIVGRFGVRVLQEIIRYADSWGNLFPSRINATGEVVVPSSDLFTILMDHTQIQSTQGNPNATDFSRQVQENGYLQLQYAGRTWRFIPDVTIPTGTAYPVFSNKAGTVFLKPGLDEEVTETDRQKHYEERFITKVFGAYIVKQKRMNVARFTYK